ncbi:MAG TPA: M24 family metallopeptidase [Candidatus Krumholzibacteria bacterium]|nr:M24 family metallopeptidase [Candidatus Krumholzibacteria bacterium]
MFNLKAVQNALTELGFDAWLLYDFRSNNPLALRVIDLDGKGMNSRRFFYLIPAKGTPRKLVHRIESAVLDHLPGDKIVYLRWQELEAGIKELVSPFKRVAMEYSPRAAIPYVASVDAGTVELVKGMGVEVASSGDLIQVFEAMFDDDQWKMHLEADKLNDGAYEMAWKMIADGVRKASPVSEVQVQQAIMDYFKRHGMTTYHPPIVGVGPHSGDPHYEPVPTQDSQIREGDFILIDLWAKMDRPRGVYSDITRVGFVGNTVPDEYTKVFKIVQAARDAAVDCVRDAFKAGRTLHGWEVDDAARNVIEKAGYGKYFVHRTGHSIGQETHGNGANMDNLETHDERMVLRRTCFSVEPGIYLPEFGVRLEVDVFVDADGKVHVTGGPQTEVLPILAKY